MSRITNFTDLHAYQQAFAVAQKIFEITKRFPPEEKYSLTDQLRRSSRSIAAQIAEGWGKRRYRRHFISKLTDADAEQLETRHWIGVAAACGYLTSGEERELVGDLTSLGGKLGAMLQRASSFVPPNAADA